MWPKQFFATSYWTGSYWTGDKVTELPEVWVRRVPGSDTDWEGRIAGTTVWDSRIPSGVMTWAVRVPFPETGIVGTSTWGQTWYWDDAIHLFRPRVPTVGSGTGATGWDKRSTGTTKWDIRPGEISPVAWDVRANVNVEWEERVPIVPSSVVGTSTWGIHWFLDDMVIMFRPRVSSSGIVGWEQRGTSIVDWVGRPRGAAGVWSKRNPGSSPWTKRVE